MRRRDGREIEGAAVCRLEGGGGRSRSVVMRRSGDRSSEEGLELVLPILTLTRGSSVKK